MKNIIAIFGLLLVFTFVSTNLLRAEDTNISEVNIKTTATCDMCKTKIEKYVNKMEGIQKSDLNLDSKIIYVKFDKTKVTVEDIKNTIKDLGYNADEVKRDERAYKKLPKCCK
jgi:copper chaperone CopZ